MSKADVTGTGADQRDIVTLPNVLESKPKGSEAHPHKAMLCHVCAKMRRTRPEKHSSLVSGGIIRRCLLCCRDYCDGHNGHEEDVCEINHETYFRDHRNLEDVYPSMAVRESALGTGN